MKHCFRTLVCAVLIGAATTVSAQDAAETTETVESTEPNYPAVFGSAAELSRLGITLQNYGPGGDKTAPLKNKCYYYGFGGNFISVSDDFLNQYQARGFSLNSLCLALQSPLAYDPETGQQLPSYMVADIEAVRQAGPTALQGEFDVGVISEALPLVVPDCFKRGLPFHDCKFRYDVRTGNELTAAELALIATGRRIFDEKMAEIKANNAYAKECGCKELNDDPTKIFSTTDQCRAERVPACETNDESSVGLLHPEGTSVDKQFGNSGIAVIDISPSLPLGFGYQIYTFGNARPQGGDPKPVLDPIHIVLEKNYSPIKRRMASK